jgi:U6 snRNA phosphodiesterase
LIESPHLSLSKTFILKHHWIDNFVTTLKSKFKDSKQDEVFLQFNKSQVLFLSNEEKTRHFACLPVEEYAYSILKSILDKVDSCLEEFNLPTYYKDPKFHISILWKLNEFTEDEKVYIENQLNKINENLEFNATQINFKTGNKFFNINL